MPDTPLSTENLNARLMELDGWKTSDDGKSIRKTFAFDGFDAAMRFVNQSPSMPANKATIPISTSASTKY